MHVAVQARLYECLHDGLIRILKCLGILDAPSSHVSGLALHVAKTNRGAGVDHVQQGACFLNRFSPRLLLLWRASYGHHGVVKRDLLVQGNCQCVFGKTGVHWHARWKQRKIIRTLLHGHSRWPCGVARPIGPHIQLICVGSQGKRSAFKLREQIDQLRGLIAHGVAHLLLELGVFLLFRGGARLVHLAL